MSVRGDDDAKDEANTFLQELHNNGDEVRDVIIEHPNNMWTTYITKEELRKLSIKEIEYARVWLQIVGNEETGKLTASYTSAGETINPYDENSANLKEDVIKLGGKI